MPDLTSLGSQIMGQYGTPPATPQGLAGLMQLLAQAKGLPVAPNAPGGITASGPGNPLMQLAAQFLQTGSAQPQFAMPRPTPGGPMGPRPGMPVGPPNTAGPGMQGPGTAAPGGMTNPYVMAMLERLGGTPGTAAAAAPPFGGLLS